MAVTFDEIRAAVNTAYRNHVVQGVPSTGDHNPVKSDIRAALALMVIALEDGGFAEPPDWAADLATVVGQLDEIDGVVNAAAESATAAAASAAAASTDADRAEDARSDAVAARDDSLAIYGSLGQVEAAATAAQQALQEIEDLASGAPEAPSIVTKANRDGSNMTRDDAISFRAAADIPAYVAVRTRDELLDAIEEGLPRRPIVLLNDILMRGRTDVRTGLIIKSGLPGLPTTRYKLAAEDGYPTSKIFEIEPLAVPIGEGVAGQCSAAAAGSIELTFPNLAAAWAEDVHKGKWVDIGNVDHARYIIGNTADTLIFDEPLGRDVPAGSACNLRDTIMDPIVFEDVEFEGATGANLTVKYFDVGRSRRVRSINCNGNGASWHHYRELQTDDYECDNVQFGQFAYHGRYTRLRNSRPRNWGKGNTGSVGYGEQIKDGHDGQIIGIMGWCDGYTAGKQTILANIKCSGLHQSRGLKILGAFGWGQSGPLTTMTSLLEEGTYFGAEGNEIHRATTLGTAAIDGVRPALYSPAVMVGAASGSPMTGCLVRDARGLGAPGLLVDGTVPPGGCRFQLINSDRSPIYGWYSQAKSVRIEGGTIRNPWFDAAPGASPFVQFGRGTQDDPESTPLDWAAQDNRVVRVEFIKDDPRSQATIGAAEVSALCDRNYLEDCSIEDLTGTMTRDCLFEGANSRATGSGRYNFAGDRTAVGAPILVRREPLLKNANGSVTQEGSLVVTGTVALRGGSSSSNAIQTAAGLNVMRFRGSSPRIDFADALGGGYDVYISRTSATRMETGHDWNVLGAFLLAGQTVFDSSRHLRKRIYTRQTLPTAASSNVGHATVSNPEVGKSRGVENTGSAWVYDNDGSAVSLV